MPKDLFEPDTQEVKNLLAEAWVLARKKYPDEHDAQRFMEHPHKVTLGTAGTAQELSSPEVLIRHEGQRGFDLVKAALTQG